MIKSKLLWSKIYKIIEQNAFVLHVIECVSVILFTFFGVVIIYKIIEGVLPIRVRDDQEERGLDISQHGEVVI